MVSIAFHGYPPKRSQVPYGRENIQETRQDRTLRHVFYNSMTMFLESYFTTEVSKPILLITHHLTQICDFVDKRLHRERTGSQPNGE